MKKILFLSFAALMLASTQVFAEDLDPEELQGYKFRALNEIELAFSQLSSKVFIESGLEDYYLNRVLWADTKEGVDNIKNQALTYAPMILKVADDVGGGMATPCEDCHAIEVTKDDKTITLYAPDQVKYIKVKKESQVIIVN